MKRSSVIAITLFLFTLSGVKVFAQSDDVYYDPSADKGSQQSSQQEASSTTTDPNNNDGYSQGQYQLKGSDSYVDSSGNTYVTNNYYQSDDDLYYTSRL
ncbi:MAG TPA: hypothetical protein VG603_10305, partial [Chitinophagales bacterium]|nr:hypothetical protein [Chitinophagales bacterium]